MSDRNDFNIKYNPDEYNSEEYFESHKNDSKGFNSYADGKGIIEKLFTEIDLLLKDVVTQNTHLDVACAYGWSVLTMQNLGWKSEGFDYAQFAVDHAPKEVNVYKADALDSKTWNEYANKEFGLISANEFFEHVPTEEGIKTIKEMARVSDWGFFTISANTTPRKEFDLVGTVQGHLNCHDITFWIKQFAEVGRIDYELMHEFNKFADGIPGIKWHCRTIIVKFN